MRQRYRSGLFPMEDEDDASTQFIANALRYLFSTFVNTPSDRHAVRTSRCCLRKIEGVARGRDYLRQVTIVRRFRPIFGAAKQNLNITRRHPLQGTPIRETQISRFRRRLVMLKMVVVAYRK